MNSQNGKGSVTGEDQEYHDENHRIRLLVGYHGQVIQGHAGIAEGGPHLERAKPERRDISILSITSKRVVPPSAYVRSNNDESDERKENVVLTMVFLR